MFYARDIARVREIKDVAQHGDTRRVAKRQDDSNVRSLIYFEFKFIRDVKKMAAYNMCSREMTAKRAKSYLILYNGVDKMAAYNQ